ncbi:hypothetical protein ACFFRR_011066 [Megaselia abdita]
MFKFVTVLFAAVALVLAEPGVVNPLITPLSPVGYTLPSAPLAYSRYFGNSAAQVDLRENYLRGYPAPIAVPAAYASPIAKYAVPSPFVSKYAVPSPYAGLYSHPSFNGFGYRAHGPAFF